MLPDLRLTIVSTVPAAHLRSRIHGDFEKIEEAVDFGMIMASALDVLADESLVAYREFHRDWHGKVAREAERIRSLAPDLVLSNVAYLPLAAARAAGVRGIAMCSLNWLEIFRHYCGQLPGAQSIVGQMREAYAAADFLRVTPGMAMADLPRVESIGPIARIGQSRRPEIAARLNLAPQEKLVLVSMGGIATASPLANWPHMKRVRWLVPRDWHVERTDVALLESLDMDFTDVLASCDVFINKPGYGSFAEAACNGVPVLYVSRHDWPEEPYLVSWLAQHGHCAKITREQFERGELQAALGGLLAAAHPPAVKPDGIDQAADYLLRSISIASP